MDSLMDAREKYFGLLRAGSDVENRWGSCGKRGFGWGFYIWKDMGREVGKGGLEKFRAYNEMFDSNFLGSEGMYMEGVYIGYIIDV